MNSIFYLIFGIVYMLLIVGTILIVLTDNQQPTKTIAWLLILIFLPAVGLIFYYIFGQNTRKKRKKKFGYEQYSQEVLSGLRDRGILPESLDYSDKIPPRYQPIVNLLKRSEDSIVWYGSDVEIITSGERKFQTLIESLENAKHHIHMEYFYFKKDNVGKTIREILMRKASEGVKVRFLYENIANIFVSTKYYLSMRKAGVEVVAFTKTTLPWIRRQLNYRNHRKIVVVDGEIGYTGGMNVGNEYYKGWRDTHLRIKGQGVYGLQSSFLYVWLASGGIPIEDYSPYFPPCEHYSENLMQIVPESPDSEWPYLLMGMNSVVSKALNYIYIQTPYYMPSGSLLQALESAALSGVDVRIMLSHKADIFFMDPATQSYYEESLRAGIRIYESQDKFIHAKSLVVDDYISVIGSANLDFRSLELSFEINSFLYDKDLAAQNKAIFFEDMEKCKEIVLEDWEKRPWWKKIIESIMRLFSPLL